MDKQSALARKRAAQEAKRRSRKRRLWGIGIGAAVLVMAAVIFTVVYFAVLKDEPPATAEPITELIIEDLVEGTGAQAQSGNTLSVYYTGWLYDGGAQFDTNVGGNPFEFTMGATPRQVIKGWDQGLAGMKVGGTRKLTIPADLAYGAAGYGDIPPNAALVFEVQLLSIE
jgi:FKBP-type peptidyl-prolyl cis-trans isomerase FkpA